MSRKIKFMISAAMVISILCTYMSGCTKYQSVSTASDGTETSAISAEESSEAESEISSAQAISSAVSSATKSTSSTTVTSSKKASSSKAAVTSSKKPSTQTVSSKAPASQPPAINTAIKTTNDYNSTYGALNQQQYDLISKRVEYYTYNIKKDMSVLESNYTRDSFKARYHANYYSEEAERAICAYDTAIALGKGTKEDGLNAYNIFAYVDSSGDDPKYRGSVARAAEAMCHRCGVDCKVVSCPQADLAFICVKFNDGKWYYYNGYDENGFVTDPKIITKCDSPCQIFY